MFDNRLNSVDVLYSNSALQYFPDNKFLTKLMLMCTPKWILLDDVQAAVGGEFFSMQHYYGAEIPCRFLTLQSCINEMWRMGYTLQGKWEYPSVIGGNLDPSLGNASDSDREVGAPYSLLFKKKSPHSEDSQYGSKVEYLPDPNPIEVK